MKITTVIGARPQFIKAAMVCCALRAVPSATETLIDTGQHYDENLSRIFFDEMRIPRLDHELEIGSGTHAVQTGRMLAAIEPLLLADRPDLVLVYGDTNSTLSGIGFTYDVSTLYFNMACLLPACHRDLQLTRLSYFWEDGLCEDSGLPMWWESINLASAGMKVINFHPLNVFLNAPDSLEPIEVE